MPSSKPKQRHLAPDGRGSAEVVAGILENYARRGVFRGFSPGPISKGKVTYRIVWHFDRVFELTFDIESKKMRFPSVLPKVPAGSRMYQELKEFIKSRHEEGLPEHRGIDRRKAEVRPHNTNGNVSLTLSVKSHDYEYGTRKLVHLVHEVFMTFLRDGSYYEYLVDTFDLTPEGM